jgi:copper chaperone
MTTRVYRVPDVSCEHCISAIQRELQKLDGVRRVDVNLDTKLVTVESDEHVSDEALRSGIDEAGYDIAA